MHGKIEEQKGEGVLFPAALALLIDAGQPVDQPLQRPEHRAEQALLALVDLGHVGAQRLHQQREDDEECRYRYEVKYLEIFHVDSVRLSLLN